MGRKRPIVYATELLTTGTTTPQRNRVLRTRLTRGSEKIEDQAFWVRILEHK